MKYDLKQYKKINESKQRDVVTTISISVENKKFIDENQINLSRLVRDFLDSLKKSNKGDL